MFSVFRRRIGIIYFCSKSVLPIQGYSREVSVKRFSGTIITKNLKFGTVTVFDMTNPESICQIWRYIEAGKQLMYINKKN